MKNGAKVLCAGLLVLGLSGCYTTGLSSREVGGYNYSNFVYSLYGNDSSGPKQKVKINKPIHIAVAQIGEAAPPKAMKTKLLAEHFLVSNVVEIPGGGADLGYYSGQNGSPNAQMQLKQMLNLTQDMNADYLFLVGGTADINQSYNWSGVLDLSLVGMFVIPSQDLEIAGKASGALIEASTGRVLFIVSSQADVDRLTTTAGAEGSKIRALANLRDNLLSSLAEEFIQKLKDYREEI